MQFPVRSSQAFTLVALLVLGACTTPAKIPSPEQPETLGVDPTQAGTRDSVIALGRRQQYDENIGAAARSILDQGADVSIQPMEHAFQADTSTLEKGVVVARFINHSQTAVPRLGLAPESTTYWLVYRRDGKLVSDFIADTKEDRFDRTGVPTARHLPTRAWRQSISQWQLPGPVAGLGAGAAHLLVEAGSQPWVTCGAGCCKPHD